MIPLYGFLEGDTIGLLLLAKEDEPVSKLVEQLQASARVRVRPRASMVVMHNGRVLDARMSLAQAGIGALDRIDVVEQR